MKKAYVICIGNELLNGRTLNTNLQYLSQQFFNHGIEIAGSSILPDEQGTIVKGLDFALGEAEIIVLTGGLGPTDDDLTREAMAEFLKVDLVQNDAQLMRLTEFFEKRNKPMPQLNVCQAFIPKGAQAIDNPNGTAPGIYVRQAQALIFALPGVPSEMQSMVESFVLPQIARYADGQHVLIRRLHCFGTGESNIAEMIGDMMRRDRNPLVNITAGAGVITLHIIGRGKDEAAVQAQISEDEQKLRGILGELVFGCDGQTLPQIVGQMLVEKGQFLCVAESCTGGLIGKMVTDVPGSSRYFSGGWITYSDQAKTRELNVPQELLQAHGAVSKQIAKAMAEGARQRSGADWAIAVTGIAGPDGGTPKKPVGLVYIALDGPNGSEVYEQHFPYQRAIVRQRTALTALNLLRKQLYH